MNIREEFAKLSDMAQTLEQWQPIEEGWLIATNNEKRTDGEWYKIEDSSGDTVSGLAIDPTTGEFELGLPGYDHTAAQERLIRRLWDLTPDPAEKGEILDRVVECRATIISGFSYPLVMLFHAYMVSEKGKQKIEKILLEKEIGLPIWEIQKSVRERRNAKQSVSTE